MKSLTKNIIVTFLIVGLILPISSGLLPSFTNIAHAQAVDAADGGRDNGQLVDAADAGTDFGNSTISAAGGSLGCLAGGFIDGLLGTGASIVGLVVPVNDSLVTSNTGAIKNKDCILDGLTTVIREVLISSLTRSIVNWINGGFNGEPAFITDLEGFLLDVGDQVLGTYIEGSELAFLCSPFQVDVRIALALNYYTENRDQVSCTLTGAIQNVEDAFGDFSSGNVWDQWFQLSINPNNNALGAYHNSRNNINQSIARAQSIESQKLAWGNGFRSYEVCDTENVENPNNSANISVGRFNCRIATPGVVISEQLSEVVGSGFRQLELADEINEIIGALLGQLSHQVLGGSQNGFSGLSQNSFSRPSYVDQLVASSEQNSESEFRDYGLSVVDGSISTENQYISTKKVSLARLNTSGALLESLSQCYAGKLSTTQSPTLTVEERVTATNRMNSATSTIAASLTPLQTLISNEIAQAENNISRLLIIKENLRNATSQFGVERVLESELDPLIENRIIHSQPDFVIAQQQKDDIQNITESMDTTTNIDLATCAAFPKREDDQNQ